MKKFFNSSAGLCLALACLIFTAPAAFAQNQTPGMSPPPKVLQIIVESLKPGQGGSPHVKSESAFVQAFKAADWTTHYFGMDALSGPSRAVFFAGYDSFDAWQKDLNATAAKPTFSAAIDGATIADGALLNAYETSVYLFREDFSLRAPVPMDHFHYMEITLFRIRSGHDKEWEELVKTYIAAIQKIPGVHWAMFQRCMAPKAAAASSWSRR